MYGLNLHNSLRKNYLIYPTSQPQVNLIHFCEHTSTNSSISPSHQKPSIPSSWSTTMDVRLHWPVSIGMPGGRLLVCHPSNQSRLSAVHYNCLYCRLLQDQPLTCISHVLHLNLSNSHFIPKMFKSCHSVLCRIIDIRIGLKITDVSVGLHLS